MSRGEYASMSNRPNRVGKMIDDAIQHHPDRRMSQSRAAELAGIAPSTVSRIVNGHRVATADTLRLLAPILRLRAVDLLSALIEDGEEMDMRTQIESRINGTPSEEIALILEDIKKESQNDPALSTQLRTWLAQRRRR